MYTDIKGRSVEERGTRLRDKLINVQFGLVSESHRASLFLYPLAIGKPLHIAVNNQRGIS